MQPLGSISRICVALGFSGADRLLEHARSEVAAGETFLEFRLDHLDAPEQGVQAIKTLLRESPECMVIATCRRRQNQGRFNGSVEEQIRILNAAVEAGARAVDVEIETAESPGARFEMFRGRAALMLSYHNFEGTPGMEAVLARMSRIPADAYKLVTTARKPSDNFRLLSLARTHPRMPLVLLAMGETDSPRGCSRRCSGACSRTPRRGARKAPRPGRSRHGNCARFTASGKSRARPRSTG